MPLLLQNVPRGLKVRCGDTGPSRFLGVPRIFDPVWLRPLPYQDADRLVWTSQASLGLDGRELLHIAFEVGANRAVEPDGPLAIGLQMDRRRRDSTIMFTCRFRGDPVDSLECCYHG
jgi:hypothetical protein